VSADQLLGVEPVSARRKPENRRLMRTLLKVERLSASARRAVIAHINALWQVERGKRPSEEG